MTISSSMPSQRQLRVGEQLRQLISETLQRGKFYHEALLDSGVVTVTQVRPSPDLKNATVFVLSLGGADMATILPALNESAPVFQKEIGRKLRLKSTPRLKFKIDDSFDNAQRIEKIFHELPSSSSRDISDDSSYDSTDFGHDSSGNSENEKD